MSGSRYLWVVLAAIGILAAFVGFRTWKGKATTQVVSANEYVGSGSCRSCHERFYELWSTSHHGMAMQKFTSQLAKTEDIPSSQAIRIGNVSYKAEMDDKGGWIVESSTAGEHRYPIELTLGGKNVFYFLTTLDHGYLQVLPLAYQVKDKKWMDATLSMTMHEGQMRGQPVDWRDRALTFNTSCYGCHVSQIDTNYDAATDSYHTTWREPGINCETCHGPAGTHVRVYEQAEKEGSETD